VNDVANVIAVLGVYFALMAVLAVSVEAVISWLKLPFGALQGKPSPQQVLDEVKGWLPEDDQDEATIGRVTALNKALKAIGEVPITQDLSVTNIVETIGIATTKHITRERNRRAVIRVLAILLGIVLAWVFQIDTLQLLAPLLEPAQSTLGNAAHVVGLVLSGLAASAGSSFWHDQSARLRSLKDATEAIGGLAASGK
jgi:hypothetical protein